MPFFLASVAALLIYLAIPKRGEIRKTIMSVMNDEITRAEKQHAEEVERLKEELGQDLSRIHFDHRVKMEEAKKKIAKEVVRKFLI